MCDLRPHSGGEGCGDIRALSPEEDIATLRRRENVSLVYLKATATGIEKVVMPVHGLRLWGTFTATWLGWRPEHDCGPGLLSAQGNPGLGGEVDNSKWKASWQGVRLFNDMGQPQVKLVKQRSASSNPAASYEVDALSVQRSQQGR